MTPTPSSQPTPPRSSTSLAPLIESANVSIDSVPFASKLQVLVLLNPSLACEIEKQVNDAFAAIIKQHAPKR